MKSVKVKWKPWSSIEERELAIAEILKVSGGKIIWDKETTSLVAHEKLTRKESDDLMYHPSKGEGWHEVGVAGAVEAFCLKREGSVNLATHGLGGTKD